MKKAEKEKPFTITTVCRQDLVDAGIPPQVVAGLSDEDMTAIARRMGELYVEYGAFWEDIPTALESVQAKRPIDVESMQARCQESADGQE